MCRVYVVHSAAGFKGEESHAVRHLKPPRSGEVSGSPRALSRFRTQVIGALAQGSYPFSYPSTHRADGMEDKMGVVAWALVAQIQSGETKSASAKIAVPSFNEYAL